MSRNQKDTKQLYEAPLVVVIFCLILFFIFKNILFVKIALVIGLLCLVSKTLARYVSLLWEKVLKVLGFVNAHVLLSLVFILILVPIASVYKLFNKDALNLKGGKESYFTERNHQFEAKDLENPW